MQVLHIPPFWYAVAIEWVWFGFGGFLCTSIYTLIGCVGRKLNYDSVGLSVSIICTHHVTIQVWPPQGWWCWRCVSASPRQVPGPVGMAVGMAVGLPQADPQPGGSGGSPRTLRGVRSVGAEPEPRSQCRTTASVVLQWPPALAFTKAEQDSGAERSSFSVFFFNLQLLRRNEPQICCRISWQLFHSLVRGGSTRCDKRCVLWLFPTDISLCENCVLRIEFMYIHTCVHK